MATSRLSTRVLAWGAAAAVTFSGLTALAPGAAFAAAPAVPTTLSPNSPTNAYKDLELTWATVTGATSYDVQVLDDDNPDLARTWEQTTAIPRVTVPVSLPDGQYRWRVRSHSSGGTSAWTATATLTKGWEKPVTGLAAVDDRVPTLSWAALPDASFYEIEINRRSFVSPQYSQKDSFHCWTAQNTFTPYGVTLGGGHFDAAPGNMTACALASASPGVGDPKTALIFGDTYYWRVRGRDGSVDTATTSFPAASAGCLGPWLESGFTVADAPSGPGKVVTIPVGETAPTTVGTPACSDWSAESTFTPTDPGLTVGAAAAPTGLAATPSTDGTHVTGDPTFSWSPVANAVSYRLYVSRDRQIDSLDLAAGTQGTSITPASGVSLTSTDQYWAVQACSVTSVAQNTDGTDDNQIDCGPISAIHPISQVTANPAAPQSLQDKGGYLLATWSTGTTGRSAAKAYDVALRDLAKGTETVVRTDRIAADVDSGTSTLALPSSGLAEGSYAFRVRPVAENDRYTAWSALSGAVVIDKAAPSVRFASAAGFANLAPVQLTFSEPVHGVSSSTLGVRTSSGAVVPGSVALVSGNTWKFTPTKAWTTGGYYGVWTSGVADRADKPATATSTFVRATQVADSAGLASAFTTGDASWTTRTASDAYGKSYRSTVDQSSTSKRASVTTVVRGTTLGISFCKTPSSGYLRVYVDGVLKQRVSQYRSWTGCGGSVAVTGLSNANHTVVLQAEASGSRGTVTVDRLSVS